MKCSNVEVKAKIQRMAFICLSILGLAVSAGAQEDLREDLRLWHTIKDHSGKVSHPPLKRLTTGTERSNAVEWLVGTQPNTSEFVKTFRSEPIKFAEAIREAILSKPSQNLNALKTQLRTGFAAVSDPDWLDSIAGRNQKEGFAKLLTTILGNDGSITGLSDSDLRSSDFLKKVFTSDVIAALDLLRKKPKKKSDKPQKETSPPVTTGELNHEELKAIAEQVCSAERAKLEAERRVQDQIAHLEQELAAVNDAANRIAEIARTQDENDRNERQNNIDDLLKPMLEQLKDDEDSQEEETAPPPQAAPAATPPQKDDTSQDFKPTIPPQESPVPQPVGPMAGPTDPVKFAGEIRSIMPTQLGSREVADGRSAVSRSSGVLQKINTLTNDPYLMMGSMMGMGMSGPVNPMFAFQNLLRLKEAQSEVKNQLALNNANIQNIDKRLSALNKLTEKFKNSKLAISPEDLQKEQQLKATVEERKADLKSLEGAMSAAKTDEDKQSLQLTAMIKQNDVRAQERELKSFQERLGLKLAEVDGELETVRGTIEELEGLKTKLETATKELSDKDSSLGSMIAQSQLGAMQFGAQPQGRPNIYGILNGSTPTVAGAPRTGVTPQRAGIGNALAGGEIRRGNLATSNAKQ